MDTPAAPDRTNRVITRLGFATVLASAVGLWLCNFVLTTLRAELVGLPLPEELLVRRIGITLVAIAVTLCLWLILRPFDGKRLWAKIVAALAFSAPAALLIAQMHMLVFADLQAMLDSENYAESQDVGGETADEGTTLLPDETDFDITYRDRVIDLTISRYFMLLAWCALYLALLTGEKARAAERREGEFRRAAKAAELRSLRYQVNPHFLFNTLNSLSALVLTGKTQEAERMIQVLSTFYRRSLADDPTADVPLGEEIRLQRLYLEIEAVRFPRRLQTEFAIPPELASKRVPGMILQPLVENSVKHAVSASPDPVTIRLEAREEYGRLVITVADDGPGIASRDDTRPGFGIGLENVRQRLEARFGDNATVVSGPGERGYVTHIRIPIIEGEDR